MRIAIFGLGYVGSVSGVCLAAAGHEVIGVDPDPIKVSALGDGEPSVVEPGLADLARTAVLEGRLRATDDPLTAVEGTDLALVCVGTPSDEDGGLDTSALERVTEQIGAALRDRSDSYTIVYRSTMLPGTCESKLIPKLEATAERPLSESLTVCVHPEYLREGSSVADFLDPAKTVVGESHPHGGDRVLDLYRTPSTPIATGEVFRMPLMAAEMSKYVDNAFHALKVSFANEIGTICRANDLDAYEVMAPFMADHRLNISAAYLKPGFSFGGSCLPKDLRALIHHTREQHLDVPVLDATLESNRIHLERVLRRILRDQPRKALLAGLAFKTGTDDLRESPLVELAERLSGKGVDVAIVDPNVAMGRLHGSNRTYIDNHLPHLGELLTDDAEAAVRGADVVVFGAANTAVLNALLTCNDKKLVVDLCRLNDAERLRQRHHYSGVAW